MPPVRKDRFSVRLNQDDDVVFGDYVMRPFISKMIRDEKNDCWRAGDMAELSRFHEKGNWFEGVLRMMAICDRRDDRDAYRHLRHYDDIVVTRRLYGPGYVKPDLKTIPSSTQVASTSSTSHPESSSHQEQV